MDTKIKILMPIDTIENAKRQTTALIILNVLLLLVLVAVVLTPTADAQSVTRHRFNAVSGRVNGVSSGVVFLLDSTSQELVAITWDHNSSSLDLLGYRGVGSDIASVSRR
ncbi:MAG: hypothetical protein QGF07_03830 [Phycisphaerales bacterium]|nr:hypothetical protein [Phycisphaerales bacterium]